MFLEEVAALKRQEVEKRKKLLPLRRIQKSISALPPPRDFLQAISSGTVSIIAEIKEASPSAGVIRARADRVWLAGEYEKGGAKALSVLTERNFFCGDLSHLRVVKDKTTRPVLMKDFIIDPFQIYEGRAAGADAVLLIAELLNREQLIGLVKLCRDLGLTPLVEIHDEEDLAKIPIPDLPLVGVNNRNLKTLKVDFETTFRLIGRIPRETAVVSESGIQNRVQVERLQEAGVKAVLVGEVLMRAAAPALKIRELMGEV